MWLLVLKACLCSLNLSMKLRTVCPTYTLLQSGHVSLYAPERVYFSVGWGLGISCRWMVLFMRRAILRSVFFNRLVMKVVSLPMYVNGTHLYVVLLPSLTNVVTRFWVGGLCMWVEKPLLVRMLWMVSSSSLYSFSFRWYVYNLLYRNLIAA